MKYIEEPWYPEIEDLPEESDWGNAILTGFLTWKHFNLIDWLIKTALILSILLLVSQPFREERRDQIRRENYKIGFTDGQEALKRYINFGPFVVEPGISVTLYSDTLLYTPNEDGSTTFMGKN